MKQGFTLLELLLVTLVLGVLTALLAPYMVSAHEAALDSVCKSNLKQLAQYLVQYSMETGYLPWGSINPMTHDRKYCEVSGGAMLYPLERPTRYGAKSWTEWSTFCWDFIKKKDENVWRLGPMFGRGNGAKSICGCPKCKNSSDNWDGNTLTGYNYNVAYLGYVEGDAGGRDYPIRFDEVLFPEKVVVFGDGGYSGGPNKFMRATKQDKAYDKSSASLRRAGTQAFRHGKGNKRHCNMAFLDGHVEAFYNPYKSSGKPGWVDEDSHTAFISSGNGIYGPRGWGESDTFTE